MKPVLPSTRVLRCLLVLGLASCSFLAGLVAPAGVAARSRSLAAAREFNAFRLFYDGPMARGLRLHDVLSARDFGRLDWTFIYGTCHASSEGGCAPPVEVQDWSICVRYPERYPGRLPLHSYRGATAAWNRFGGAFEIYTGHTAIAIFAPSRDDAKRMARLLRPVRASHRSTRFPAPAKGALRGKLPCQGGAPNTRGREPWSRRLP